MYSSLDTVWVLLCTALIFFMQAGFAMLETGFTRAKNAGNIIMKNLMDYCIGSVLFWVIGFSFLYGDSIGGFIGTPSLFEQESLQPQEICLSECSLCSQRSFVQLPRL